MKSITIGRYIPGDSILHKLDPRTKLFAALLMILSLYVLPQLPFYAVYALLLCVLYRIADLSPSLILQDLKRIWFLLLVTFLMRLITTTGEPIVSRNTILPFTHEGLDIGLQMSIRIALMVSTASFLSRLASPKVYADGLQRSFSFLEPLGVPMDDIGLMSMLAFRFIPSLYKEIQTLMDAQRSRGVVFEEGGFIGKSRKMVKLLPPLFLSLIRRSDELATAMTIRGFTGDGHPRSKLRPLEYEKADYISYGFSATFFLIVVIVRLWPRS